MNVIINNCHCIYCKNNIKQVQYIQGLEYKNKLVYIATCKKCNKKILMTLKRKRTYFFDKDKTLFIKDIIQPIQNILKEFKKERTKQLINIKRNIKEKEFI